MSDEELLKILIRAYALMRREPGHSSDDGDLMTLRTKGFGSVLDILAQQDGVSQGQIVEAANMRQQSVSEALGMLEKRGCISRKPSETDKRVSLIFLTEEGRIMQKELQSRRQQMAKNFFSCLTQEEKASLYQILLKLVKAAT